MSSTALPPSAAKGSRAYGFVEWFRPGEYERTLEILPHIKASGASHLRTHLSWAEYLAPGGEEWFDWMIPTVGKEIDLLLCVHYTPPSMSAPDAPPVRRSISSPMPISWIT